MPPPLLLLLLLLPHVSSSPSPFPLAGYGRCSSPPRDSSPCPPFPFPPSSFPFSATAGCGHPSFQIRCSGGARAALLLGPYASPYLVLATGANQLLLSPSTPDQQSACLSIPGAPVPLAGSPFRPSAAACASLSAAAASCPAPPANFSFFCRLSPWQRRLLTNPSLLLPECYDSAVAGAGDTRCAAGDVVRFITGFLRDGVLVEWNPSSDPYFANCSNCHGGSCGFNDSASGKPFVCLRRSDSEDGDAYGDSTSAPPSSTSIRSFVIAMVVIFGAVAALLALVCICAAVNARRHLRGRGVTVADITAAFLRRHSLHPPVIPYEQLRAATNNFDRCRKIGDGGFGSVYLADLGGGRLAAVKQLHRHHPEAASAARVTKSFYNEILILSSLRHPNLVRLHGYCADPRGLLLVYDYVPNGTLAEHLHGARRGDHPLPWATRVNAASQIAAALEYLHYSVKPPVVHRDVTSSNIFIEADMRIKLGDFGLSRLLTLPDACSTSGSRELVSCTGPQGTPGYLDPDYHRSLHLTEKSDVYSFGVVLLELVTGMQPVDVSRERREVALADWAIGKIQVGELWKVVDRALLTDRNGREANKDILMSIEAVAELAFRCVAGDKDDRPSAKELVEELRRIQEKLRETPTELY